MYRFCKNTNCFAFRNALQTKHLTTWSHLAISFNTKPAPKSWLKSLGGTGLFGKSRLRSASGLHELKKKADANTDSLLEEVLNPDRSRRAVQILDDMSDGLCQVADLAEFVRMIHPDQAFIDAADTVCSEISNTVEELNTHKEMYDSLKKEVENSELTEEEKHVGKLLLFDFEQSGIDLSEDDREQVVKYNGYILQFGQRFAINCNTPSTIKKEKIPQEIIHYFARNDDDDVLINSYADFPDPLAREVAYKAYLYPYQVQETILDNLLLYRQRLAEKCGFKNYTERAVKGSIADSGAFVKKFLDHLNTNLQEWTKNDFDILRKMKQQESQKDLAVWDVAYLMNKSRTEWLNADALDYSPYFSIGACMEGFSHLLNSLFGITLLNEETAKGETWAPDIYKLAVQHEDEGLLGHIYCDFYERKGKINQDCHFTIRGGRLLEDGSYQNPIVVVVLNCPPPSDKPSLLTPSMMENLFHEMGHAIHSMLGRTRFQHVTGTRCSTDFAEVPSILMENFATDARVLRTFARHYITNELLPEGMIEKLSSCRHLFQALDLQTQVFYSALDYKYHTQDSTGKTTQILQDVQAEYYGLPYVPNTAWQLRFSHLVGYGAKYYSYILSRAVATSIWEKYFEENPLDRAAGERYRRECLAHGGAKPAQKLVGDYLDIDVTPENLTSSLINDVNKSYIQYCKLIA